MLPSTVSRISFSMSFVIVPLQKACSVQGWDKCFWRSQRDFVSCGCWPPQRHQPGPHRCAVGHQGSSSVHGGAESVAHEWASHDWQVSSQEAATDQPLQVANDACHRHGYADSDWAGRLSTARSTSRGRSCLGDHVVKSYSRQQNTVALKSDADSEAPLRGAASSSSAISPFDRVEDQLTASGVKVRKRIQRRIRSRTPPDRAIDRHGRRRGSPRHRRGKPETPVAAVWRGASCPLITYPSPQHTLMSTVIPPLSCVYAVW